MAKTLKIAHQPPLLRLNRTLKLPSPPLYFRSSSSTETNSLHGSFPVLGGLPYGKGERGVGNLISSSFPLHVCKPSYSMNKGP